MSNSLVGLSLFAGSASLVYAVRALLKRGASSASSAAGAAMDIEDCAKVLCAKRGSVPVDVVAGKTYYYCTCGRSDKQPFCNGAHKGTRFAPTAWTATETKTVYFCGCKQGPKQPLCNGAHKSIPEDATGKLYVPVPLVP